MTRRIAVSCLLLAMAGCSEVDWHRSIGKMLEQACASARNCHVERSGRDPAPVP